MNRVFQCVGRYASAPYIIENTCISVWCLEELCYYICEYADLLDEHFASNALLDWIAEECGMKDLSRRLKAIRRQSMKLESFTNEILNEAHYVDEEELKRISRVIRANRSMPESDRNMVLADYFLRGGNYIPALNTYRHLLEMEENIADTQRRAKIYLNVGVIYARLFYFKEAADFYRLSYDTFATEEAMFGFLASKRMELPDGEYLKLLSDMGESAAISTEVEAEVERLRKTYRETGKDRTIERLRKSRMGNDRSTYEAEALTMLKEEKERYRRLIAE